MKTIRYNTYETNSSSTHSITIINKSRLSDPKIRKQEILNNNVLYPLNLSESIAYTDIPTGEGGYILKCITPYQKAALTVHYLNACDEWVEYESDDTIDAEDYARFKVDAIKILTEKLLLDDIVDWKECNGFYYDSENESCPIIKILEDEDRIGAFNKYTTDVILNDDIAIVDEDIPY